jgi:putative addiction module antidote
MRRKVLRAGNSLVVSLPREAIEVLGLSEGSEVDLKVDSKQAQVVISARSRPMPKVDEVFARQVNEFIAHYRPALEELAKAE